LTVARFVVAVDGGNSKTDVVLAGLDGRVVVKMQAGGTRPHLDGMERTARDLAQMVSAAKELAGLKADDELAVGAFYLANVDIPSEEAQAYTLLQAAAVANQVVVRNDVFAILRAGSRSNWGVAVVAGAGINAVGVDPDGRKARFLALGETTGDWGGGYAVGMAGLGAAVRAGDGRGPDTKLSTLVADHFGTAAAEDVALKIHQGSLDRSVVHGLAPVVFAAAMEGDPVAQAIVIRLADEGAIMATTLLRRLDLLAADADVILGGGLFQSRNPILLDRISAQIRLVATSVRIAVLQVPPVAGSLLEALSIVGATDAATDRARAYFRLTDA
jgi:N-acetylglucosamine kinase-like BadF-type ATPase